MLYKLLHLLPLMLAVHADIVPAGQATARAAVRQANAQDVAVRDTNSDTSDTDVKINIVLGADDEFMQLGFRYRHSDSKVVEPLTDATFIPEQGRNLRWRQGSNEPQNTLDGLVGAKFRLNTERQSDAVEGMFRAGDEVQGERTMLAFLFRPPSWRGIDHRMLYCELARLQLSDATKTWGEIRQRESVTYELDSKHQDIKDLLKDVFESGPEDPMQVVSASGGDSPTDVQLRCRRYNTLSPREGYRRAIEG